jgi:hypothetical protein
MVVYALVSLLLITVVRAILRKGLDLFTGGSREPAAPSPRAAQPPLALSGELKKCPACGTYNPVSLAVRRSVRGEAAYYCRACAETSAA